MSFDSSCGFLFYHLHYYGGCQYVKGTKQILIAVCCVVEFTGLHSNFLVCKFQFYTVNFTVCSVNVFTVFLYFLQNYSGNHSCQNYFVKTTDFFYSVPIACTNLHSVMVCYITAARLIFYFKSFIHLQWSLMEVNFHSVCAQECLLRKRAGMRIPHDFIR